MTKKIIAIAIIIFNCQFSIVNSLNAQPMAGSSPRIVSLSECVSTMRKENIKAANARNNVQMAEEFQKYARTKYYPTVSARAFHFEANDYLLRKDLFSPEISDAIDELNRTYDLGLDTSIAVLKRGSSADIGLVQPLYTGGRIHNVNKLADLQVEGMKLLQDTNDDILVLEAELLYFTLVKLHGKQQNLLAADAEVASILKDARNLATEGIVNSNDALTAELALDQLNAQRVRLDNGIRLLRRAMAKAMGCAGEDLDVDTTLLSTPVVAPENLWVNVESAVDNSNENRLLELNVERTQLQTKLAKANYLPILALGGNVGISRYLSKANTKGVAFATVVMPISTFWSERHLVRRSKLSEQMALDQRRDKREMLDLNIRDAYDNLSAAYQQVAIARKSIAKADENLRIKHEEYINGVTNMTILLDARQQQQTAHDNLSDALCDYHHARTKYLIATGRKEQTY